MGLSAWNYSYSIFWYQVEYLYVDMIFRKLLKNTKRHLATESKKKHMKTSLKQQDKARLDFIASIP